MEFLFWINPIRKKTQHLNNNRKAKEKEVKKNPNKTKGNSLIFIEVHVKFPWKPPLLLFNSIFIKHLSLSEKKLLLINIMGFYFLSSFLSKIPKVVWRKAL